MYASLKDVAARAGVSFQTTSKVLNGHPSVVSERTRARILRAAEDVGYVPNALARGLVNQASLTIGVLVDDFADPALARFVQAAEREAGLRRYSSLIVTVAPDGDPAPAVRRMHEHRVAGILVVAPSMEDEPRLGHALRGPLPAVSVNHIHGGGVPLVGSDHSATGAVAARHLADLGHRHVGTITGPRGRRVVRSRHRGFRVGLEEAGVRLPRHRVVEADWSSTGAHTAANRLLTGDPRITAVFVHSDVMSLGVLHALRGNGIRVPEDCSVISCDDMSFAPYVFPPLTTVRVPFEETGKQAADLLLARMAGGTTPQQLLLPTELSVRSSTAPPGRVPEQRGTSLEPAGPG